MSDLGERLFSFVIAAVLFGAALFVLEFWGWVGVVFVTGCEWEFPWWAFRLAIFGGVTVGFAFACTDEAVS